MAVAFYATTNTHAVAVLVCATRLRQLGLPASADLVAVVNRVFPSIRAAIREVGVLLIEAAPPRLVRHRYFRDSLLKCRVLQLTNYQRVVFVDVDSWPLSNLEKVFGTSFTEPLAMPHAYWLHANLGTSALIALHPSLEAVQHLDSWLATATERHYLIDDMGTLNAAFRGRIHFLPARYLRLNGDWSDAQVTAAHGRSDLSLEDVQVIHFTDLGKPWFYPPGLVRWLRPGAHPEYHEFWRGWWRLRDDAIGRTSGATWAILIYLKYWHIVFQPIRAVLRAVKRRLWPSAASS